MSFVEALDQMHVYAKFMTELMKKKQMLRNDENDVTKMSTCALEQISEY